MASSWIDPPGSEFGPCKGKCRHKDCAASREQAAKVCRICGQQIGYNRNYYKDDDLGIALVHASCFEDEFVNGKGR